MTVSDKQMEAIARQVVSSNAQAIFPRSARIETHTKLAGQDILARVEVWEEDAMDLLNPDVIWYGRYQITEDLGLWLGTQSSTRPKNNIREADEAEKIWQAL